MQKPMTPSVKTTRAVSLGIVVSALFFLSFPPLTGAGTADKKEKTGFFWQLDPDAGFEGDGSNFCAPTAISNGLIYLARARGKAGLIDGVNHPAQIALIKALAEHMETDPEIGTNPSKIIYGLQDYLQTKGYAFAALEIAGWRKVDAEHRKYLLSRKPEMKWLKEAVDDPDAVVILNNGWYRGDGEGGYVRKGGHFVIAVATGPGAMEFQVHNSAMEVEKQKANTAVTLTPVAGELVADASANGVDELNLEGFYKMEGTGLPFTPQKAAFSALDFVIVFKVKKLE